ncbi:ATP-dependent DNA helicase [Kineococcus sp. SYSU DK005]|uniref:ATP-dependent DNA helicase n=1 Tax=Kineococcus sp. SYSU DK005 TaxID=3383126 RepID=UPI003D7D10E1
MSAREAAAPRPRAAAPARPGATALLRALIAERPGGRVRPQQERLVAAVEHALRERRHLLASAGTGTGKTLGYLVPVLAGEGRAVVCTATKQLGEQVVAEDLPLLARLLPGAGGRSFTHALLKGRRNYACLAKLAALRPPGGGPARTPPGVEPASLGALLRWAGTTRTGDRSEAPPVGERAWREVSTDSAGCPGASACPFGRECFAEGARAAARRADVVVTSHAQVAHDLVSPQPLLGEYDTLVVDEAHELEAALSSAWSRELAPAALERVLARAARELPRDACADTARAQLEQASADLAALAGALADLAPGALPQLPRAVSDPLVDLAHRLAQVAAVLTPAAETAGTTAAAGAAGTAGAAGAAKGAGPAARTAAGRRGAAQALTGAAESVLAVLGAGARDGEEVRWLHAGEHRAPVLRVAPLRVGPRLVAALGDRTLVATSATITVGGSFDAAVRAFALQEPVVRPGQPPAPPRGFDVVDVGTPFDHERQALLYVPPAGFPAPAGGERAAHTAAVLQELTALVRAAGGRTLALFTTSRAARDAAAHLRAGVATPVLAQEEAPAAQLLRTFAQVEESTLCATLGLWQGVDVPGPSLSCVVMDKVPFAPADDPLMSARRTAADAAGRDGFAEVYVSAAAVLLAQGAGRLVRTATDRGVVAVLDPRLLTRAYGRTLLDSLPAGMRRFSDRDVVTAALTRLTATTGAAAVAAPPGASTLAGTGAEEPPGAGAPPGGAAPAPAAPASTAPTIARRAAPRRSATRALARRTRERPRDAPGP